MITGAVVRALMARAAWYVVIGEKMIGEGLVPSLFLHILQFPRQENPPFAPKILSTVVEEIYPFKRYMVEE